MREKQLYGYFKRQTDEISLQKTLTWLQLGKFKRETESLLLAAQNNAIKTIYIKAKINYTEQNSKCRLWDDRDKTMNCISGCS